MKVTLIARTELIVEGPVSELEYNLDPVIERWMASPEVTSAEALVEFSGRSCYQSFHKPNPSTEANADYIANILRQQHESVLEHASASFYVTGVSRNLLLELERHRHLSFSVLSQRFVNSEDAEFVAPPALRREAEPGQIVVDGQRILDDARGVYRAIVGALELEGLTRKQAREAARSVLPGGIETRFVVTGNLRAWRDVLRKRYSTHADAEIRELAEELLRQLREDVAPSVFADFPGEPFDT